jgi:hypothetical protein
MREYAREVPRQGQQGGGVATTAAPQPPQPQHVARSQLFQRASAQVTAFRSGMSRQLSEIDGYYSGRFKAKNHKEEGNEGRIEELSDEDDEQEEGQGDSSAEEEEENETGEERDARVDEEDTEKRSAVVHTQAGYVFMDERRKRTDEVTRGDDNQARIEEKVSTSASNQEKGNIRKAVAFSKQPAKADPIENTTPKTAKAPKDPRQNAPALGTGNYEVLGRSQLDYTILARQERETGEFTFRLLPKAKTASVPKDKRVTARTPAAPKKIGIAHVSALSGLKDLVGYTEFCYARASPTVLGKIQGHELPMPIDGGFEICVLSNEVARELNIGWKHANWQMITADGNRSDLSKVAESVPVNVHGIGIPVPMFLARSASEQGILGRTWVTYPRKCERNLDDGSCEITISAVDGSEQVTFVATFPGDKTERFASSSGNLYA